MSCRERPSSFFLCPMIILGCVYLTFGFGQQRDGTGKSAWLPSKHCSPHITRRHPHRRSPPPSKKTHLAHCWQGGPLGLGEGCSSSTSSMCPHTMPGSLWPESQALLPMSPGLGALDRGTRHAQVPLMTEFEGEWATGRKESHMTGLPSPSSAEGTLWTNHSA